MNIHVHDSASFDPTRTSSIRRQWRNYIELRLRQMRSAVRKNVVDGDVLGLRSSPSILLTRSGQLNLFSAWLDDIAGRMLSGEWLSALVQQAWVHGHAHAMSEINTSTPSHLEQAGRLAHLAQTELDGIRAALVQRLNRVAVDAMTRAMSPAVAFHGMAKEFDKVAVNRSRAMVNMLAVAAHNHAKLHAYRSAGIQRVGITPEHRRRMRLRDAVDPELIAEAERVAGRIERKLGGEVEVITAEDELVCDECLAIASDGPYSIEHAFSLIPAHQNCRCSFTPADESDS